MVLEGTKPRVANPRVGSGTGFGGPGGGSGGPGGGSDGSFRAQMDGTTAASHLGQFAS